MFEELMESYKLLSIADKREEILKELKLMTAIFEKMCTDRGIEYREVRSNEILDLNKGNETEDDYLEAAFVYVKFLKEVLGSLFQEF